MSHALLGYRGVIRVSGEDKFTFLQGLITQDLRLLAPNCMVYSCFLTPQGKYLADFFIMQSNEDWLIDIDHCLLPDLLKRLTLYKLRSRVTLTDVSGEYDVHAWWHEKPDSHVIFDDPRASNIGWRAITAKGGIRPEDEGDYALWQLQNGLPDVADFVRERTAMLEANMDMLNALSWDKGCYMGQELTARTHYRGLIKKRFLPLKLEKGAEIAFDTAVEKDGKTIGHTRSCHGDYTLALLQLDAIGQNDHVAVGRISGMVIFPEWFQH